MTDADTWLAVAVGGGLIVFPDPATTAAGVAIVGSQLANGDVADALVGS